MIYKKSSKIIIFCFLLTLFFSGCLQEASYIENYSLRDNLESNNKNYFINQGKNKFIDENYNNKKNNDSFNTSKKFEELNDNNDDEVKWNNVFQEYDSKEIKETQSPENVQNNKKTKEIKKSNEKKEPVKNSSKQKIQNDLKEKGLNEKKLIKPVNGQILSKFKNNQDSENGISFKAKNENIFASADGRVIYVDKHGDNGKTIIIKFNNGIVGSYVFNGESFVEINSIVEKKKIIGKINLENGKNILYFSTRENGKLNNPEKYFND